MLPNTTADGAHVELCELQASITVPPDTVGGELATSSGGLSGGAIAGIVLGGLLVAAVVALAAAYLVWRRRWLEHQRRMAALGPSINGFNQDVWDRQHIQELDSASNSTQTLGARSGSGATLRGSGVGALAAVRVGGYGGSNHGGEEADVEGGKVEADDKEAEVSAEGSSTRIKHGNKVAGRGQGPRFSEREILVQFFRMVSVLR